MGRSPSYRQEVLTSTLSGHWLGDMAPPRREGQATTMSDDPGYADKAKNAAAGIGAAAMIGMPFNVGPGAPPNVTGDHIGDTSNSLVLNGADALADGIGAFAEMDRNRAELQDALDSFPEEPEYADHRPPPETADLSFLGMPPPEVTPSPEAPPAQLDVGDGGLAGPFG